MSCSNDLLTDIFRILNQSSGQSFSSDVNLDLHQSINSHNKTTTFPPFIATIPQELTLIKIPQLIRPLSKNPRKLGEVWSPDEDRYLTLLVKSSKTIRWCKIADKLSNHLPREPARTGSQCSQRWTRVIDDSFRKGKWTEEEDLLLIEALRTSPPRRWRIIANKIPGRSDIQVRDHLQSIGEKLVEQKIVTRDFIPE